MQIDSYRRFFSSIVAAIEEGRRQYANIRKFVLYLVSSNIGEVLAILINIIVGGSLILIPIQILWINLVTDSATAISLSVEKAEKDIMQQPPRQANQRIFEWKSLLLGVLAANRRNFRTIFKQIYNGNRLTNYLGILIHDVIISS